MKSKVDVFPVEFWRFPSGVLESRESEIYWWWWTLEFNDNERSLGHVSGLGYVGDLEKKPELNRLAKCTICWKSISQQSILDSFPDWNYDKQWMVMCSEFLVPFPFSVTWAWSCLVYLNAFHQSTLCLFVSPSPYREEFILLTIG